MKAARRTWFPSFDGLRCLAIVPVVWHHATSGPLPGVLGRGPLGVDLFFAISGFLITSLLLEERAKRGAIALGRFWARRSLRIFPLYYLVLGLAVLHALFLREDGPARDYFLANVPYFATYTSNWFVRGGVGFPVIFMFAWSLAAEEQFYLVWPTVLRFVRGWLAPAGVMLGLVALDQAAERGWLAPWLGSLAEDRYPLRIVRSFATPIGLGSLLALAAAHERTRPALRALLGRRWSPALAAALVLVALVKPLSIFEAQAALALLVASCALAERHWLSRVLEHPIVRHVGVVSYGVYMLNVAVVWGVKAVVLRGADDPPLHLTVIVFVIGLAASVALATLTHRLVERPFLRLRERLHHEEPARASVAVQSIAKQ